MVIAEGFCAGYYFLNQLIIGYAKYLSCSRLLCQCMLQIYEILFITMFKEIDDLVNILKKECF